MGRYFNISLIGAGNVAWHLAPELENYGHSIKEVYSRNISNAERLCAKLYEAVPTDNLNLKNSESRIFIIAVSDKAISQIENNLEVPQNAIVLHTSGTVSLEALNESFENCGVFYPVQSFSKSRKIDFQAIPFSLEFSNEITKEVIKQLASSLTKKFYFHSTEQRRVIHLASVFAANFTNHMFTISKGLLESNELDFNLVKPLILEVVNKALTVGPENSQTGPAIRKDFNTIEKHLEYLSEEEGLTEVYRSINNDIIRTYEE